MIKNLLIGADPELFVQKKGKAVSAHDLIPGSKREPFKVKNGAVQPDGLAAEFNIDPADSADTFVNNINSVLAQLRSMIPDAELKINPVANFSREYMASLPEQAKALGCDPDYDAYSGVANNPPPQHETMRTASGHVHIGWTVGVDPLDPVHFEACRTLAKQLDIYLGTPALLYDKGGAKRRLMYGKAGCFRPKSYGMEYRTLSNWWLADERYMRWVYDNTVEAVQKLIENKGQVRTWDACRAAEYINSSVTPHKHRIKARCEVNEVKWEIPNG